VERAAAEDWIRSHVEPFGEIETEKDRPWATVLRVPLAGGGVELQRGEAEHASDHLAHGVPDLPAGDTAGAL
jgi:hypothetical protein